MALAEHYMTRPPFAPVRMHHFEAALLTALSAGILALPQGAAAQQREPWQIITPPQASLVLARDGSMIGEIGRERRVSISLASLPSYIGQAFVAVEDQRFYQHDGVDVVGSAG